MLTTFDIHERCCPEEAGVITRLQVYSWRMAISKTCPDNRLSLFFSVTPFPHTDAFWRLKQTAFENTVTKEEIAHDEQFLLFATMFSTLFSKYTYIYRAFLCVCLDTFKIVCSRFVICGKGLSSALLQHFSINVSVWFYIVLVIFQHIYN